jgi:glutaminyl-tRNA synthetase
MSEDKSSSSPTHFIEDAIAEDLAQGRFSKVHTRFPPEPNGFLHIGHASAITIDFTMAQRFGGRTNLRMDDTNPVKEDESYVEAIKRDIEWLGYKWDHFCYASDYFEQLYTFAEKLISDGLAYVDDLNAEQMREYRGSLVEPGKESPYRSRSVEENLDLFRRMRAGEFPDGAKVLRAKIDMAHPNLNMRDPAMYRIKHAHHHRTGDKWCIYPTYDYAHGQSDSIEGITHSLCSLEFEDHRPLYNWFIEKLGIFPTRQIEFARTNLTYTVMSKRKLLQLVEEKHVAGWDDPRMPTLSGLRRRGYTAESIREFVFRRGVSKTPSTTDLALLEFCLRQDLEAKADRRMAVLDPLKVVITNFPEDATEWYPGPNHPADESRGARDVPLTREIYIERDDFMEDPPKKYFRLAPGQEVRLRYACYITCTEVVRNDAGEIVELRAEFDPESRGGSTPDNRKVKGTIHWVSATENTPIEVRLYDKLFLSENPEGVEGKTFLDDLNAESLKVITAYAEPAVSSLEVGVAVQFERKGYYCVDPDSSPEKPVFNLAVALKDSWAKKQG